MQKSFVIRSATAAILAALLAPAAFAQSASRTQPSYDPYAASGGAPVCSQLELSVGLKGDECGKLTLGELAYLKADRDNTN
jgi:Spy/CpxP family protein refolding chaperone